MTVWETLNREILNSTLPIFLGAAHSMYGNIHVFQYFSKRTVRNVHSWEDLLLCVPAEHTSMIENK